jgi:hypothetical protein
MAVSRVSEGRPVSTRSGAGARGGATLTSPRESLPGGYRLVAMLAPLVLAGCGPAGPARYDVSGTVTFDGQPVPLGTITFLPAPGNSGPGGSATIENGRYDTTVSGKGPTTGPHVAVISGFDGKAVGGVEKLLEGRPLFIEYRETIEIPQERTAVDFVVPGSARVRPTPPPPPGRKA